MGRFGVKRWTVGLMRILVSACLLGINCRYCGGGCECESVAALRERHELIPVCPEQLGGLPTPRAPHEIIKGRAVGADGKDNTEAYELGARETLRLFRLLRCDAAVMKERSPSCGSSIIYDGTFSGRRIRGMGVTARLLEENGIRVVSEETLDKLEA